MQVFLWIVAGLLALVFLAAGLMKVSQPKEKLATSMGWVAGVGAGTVKAIGALEIAGAIGLILPPMTGIAPLLAPTAAVGLAITMAGAIVVHARRGEAQMIVGNVVLLALAVIVAWGRFGPYAF